MKVEHLVILVIGLTLVAACSGKARQDQGCVGPECAVVAAGQSWGSGPADAIGRRGDPDLLRRIMASDPALSAYLPQATALRLQVIYTQIDRDGQGRPTLSTYGFREDAERYFPASLVKLPVALLTLEKLNQLGLDRDDRLEIVGNTECNSYPGNGCATPGQCIARMFVFSDNDAFNRLYEFLGSDYINHKMGREKGYHGYIQRRFRRGCGGEAGRTTAAVRLYDRAQRLVYQQPPIDNTSAYPGTLSALPSTGGPTAPAGQASSLEGINFFPLSDFHEMLIAVAMPSAVPPRKRFRLREKDRAFLLRSMSMLPREYGSDRPDSFRKWLMLGTDPRIPANLRIYNKVGLWRGCVSDVAYITDAGRKLEFFLSATITAEDAGSIGDDSAQSSNRSFAFMKALGQAIYRHALGHKTAEQPDALRPTR